MTSLVKPAPGTGGSDRGKVLNLPNLITISRFVLSIVFFVLLGLFDAYYYKLVGDPLPSKAVLLLDVSIAVFILAACTDWVDGYLARKWGLVSTFGRIADPFVDKVFICGSFIFLIPITPLVPAWFVVVLIMREFLVSGLRSFLEARGVAFGAGMGGKLKMLFQSVTVPFVLFYRANHFDSRPWKIIVIVLLVLTILLTVTSTVEYVKRAIRLMRDGDSPPRSPRGDGDLPPRSPRGDGDLPPQSPRGDGDRKT
jgi:CDP-diacylglycerol--glycerol-3-phosphate 3-phosphatidyltransferase